MPGTNNPDAGDVGNGSDDNAPLERFLMGLPRPIHRTLVWLRRPEARRVRIPAAIMLIVGGLFGFLPILGFWMVPLGIILLSEDVPVLRRPTVRALGSMQRWWDQRRAGMEKRP